MINRRALLWQAAGAIPLSALALKAGAQGLLLDSEATQPGKSNGAFFAGGNVAGGQVTLLQSNVGINRQPKYTTLAGVAGQSPSMFLMFYLNAFFEPINTMPIVVVKDPYTLNDLFRVEIWPAGEIIRTLDSSGTKFINQTFSVPILRTLFAATIRGGFYFVNYITLLPKFAQFVQGLYRIFYNYSGPSAPVNGTFPISGFGNFAVLHNVPGDNGSLSVQTTYYGDFGAPEGQPLVPVNWGTALATQPDYYIGGDPTTLSPSYSLHGVIGGVNLVTGNIPAPIDTASLTNPNTGGFLRPPTGGFGSPSALYLMGGGGFGGIGYNLGPEFLVPGTGITLDTTLNTGEGLTEPSHPPAGTDILFEDD